MNKDIGTELREYSQIPRETLSTTLYDGREKQRSNIGLGLSQDLIASLEGIVNNYMRVMGLDSSLYPARVDLGFSEKGIPIIYEITTGFVDQIGSCLELSEAYEIGDRTCIASDWPMSYATLATQEYRSEYKLMLQYLEKYGVQVESVDIRDILMISEKCFVYGYPTTAMNGKDNFIPGIRGLRAEDKLAQGKVIQKLVKNTHYYVPRIFSQSDTNYSELPDKNNTKLVFKQILPKTKGDRNTISTSKSKYAQQRYISGEMIAQEYIPPYRYNDGKRVEGKVIMLPTTVGSSCVGFYSLTDLQPGNASSIINDGFPQGPGYII